jgi:thiamine pyrophosphokinase
MSDTLQNTFSNKKIQNLKVSLEGESTSTLRRLSYSIVFLGTMVFVNLAIQLIIFISTRSEQIW